MVADGIFLQEIHLNELHKNLQKELGNRAYASSRKISLWQLRSGNILYYKIIENSGFCSKGPFLNTIDLLVMYPTGWRTTESKVIFPTCRESCPDLRGHLLSDDFHELLNLSLTMQAKNMTAPSTQP